MSDPVTDKAAARVAAFARRKGAHGRVDAGPAQAALERALAPHAGATLAGYMPIHSEIDPLPVMARWAATAPVCVPVIAARAAPLRFRAWRPGAAMVRGDFGALVPAEGPWCRPEVLIVPLVAFDAAGYRLGYGGGFYDRTLAELRRDGPVTAIGFAYAAQEAAAVPREAIDQPLDLLVTEAGVRGPW